jgi:hypothetical protein
MGMTEPGTAGPPGPPSTLRWAVILLVSEAVMLAAVAGLLVYEDLTETATSSGGAVFVTVLTAAMAALLVVLARALGRRRGWARGPAVFVELMLLPVGYYMIKGGLPAVGIPVLLLGLFGVGLLVAPATREALGVR